MPYTLALIAHDGRKQQMLELAARWQTLLASQHLLATATTGRLLGDATGLPIECLLSGPHGGDLQIGARIAAGSIDAVIFLRDPLTAQPHEPDISALLRVCEVHDVPVATNLSGATILLRAVAESALPTRA